MNGIMRTDNHHASHVPQKAAKEASTPSCGKDNEIIESLKQELLELSDLNTCEDLEPIHANQAEGDNCPFDEDQSSESSCTSASLPLPTSLSLVGSLNKLVQTPKGTKDEGDALAKVSRLMDDMFVILDGDQNSVQHTPTPMKYRQQFVTTPFERTKRKEDDPEIVVNLSLLKQIACATDLSVRENARGSASDGEKAIVKASFLVNSCQVLLDERDEMVQEALGLMESVREEAKLSSRY